MKKLFLCLLVSLMAIPASIYAQTVTVTTPYFSTSYSNSDTESYYCSGYHYDIHHHRHHDPRKCKACKKARKAWEKAHKHHNKAHRHAYKKVRNAPRPHHR